MDIRDYAACFVRGRIGYEVSQELVDFAAFIHDGNSYNASGYITNYLNFTSYTIVVTTVDGKKLKIPPSSKELLQRNINGNKIIERYDKNFVVLKTYNNHCKLEKTKLNIKVKSGEKINFHADDIAAANNRTSDGEKYSIARSVSEQVLADNFTGVEIPQEMISVCLDRAGYKPVNKIATAFPNRGATSPTAGVRIHATVSSSYLKTFYITIGTVLYKVSPKLCDSASNEVHIYHTETNGEEVLHESIPIEKLFEEECHGVRAFHSEKEASDSILELLKARDKYKELLKENKKLKDDLEKAQKDAFNAKSDAKAEKNKSSNTRWQKATAIITAICSALAAIIGLIIKYA